MTPHILNLSTTWGKGSVS